VFVGDGWTGRWCSGSLTGVGLGKAFTADEGEVIVGGMG